ncbi:GNAT family N-acetyltransferase [Propionivibrio dicarboxylicus]|uniref:N-acetyltransferase domain-containing protein n=1 Tax=Propionivibrio dicarboxylicus TaxID=83767 RepID=A0A1G8AR00_9RHOO|nr:GNAT family N-acetyltransferase [Propionivibrio dicarboxylicus]SDH23349.1 hypothetical protein SAMN05660652_01468 [Propionivibrio dicarboxylicus]
MQEIRPCKVDDFFAHADAPALLAEYADESAILGLPAPKPAPETYQALEAAGILHVFAAFDGEALIGFISLLLSFNPHYSAFLAVTESLFVTESKRGAGAGLALIRRARDEAITEGAVGFLLSAPTGSRLHRLLEHMECRETNRIFFWSLP